MNATRKHLLLILAAVGTHWQTRAQFAIPFGSPVGDTYSAAWSGSQAIPDNDASGLAFGLSFNDPTVSSISGLSVTFTIEGGYNGDYYAYLSHGSGFTVLLNRIGVGASNSNGADTSGFRSFTLSTDFSTDVHGASGTPGAALGGDYAPDGRFISPFANAETFDSAPRNATFSTQLGGNPDGAWTLFFADVSPASSGTITGFEVRVTAVPEPASGGLWIATAALVGTVVHRLRRHGVNRRSVSKDE